MLSLQGIPALYIHTLTGTLNDVEGVSAAAAYARLTVAAGSLMSWHCCWKSPSTTHDVFHALHRLLVQRRQKPCFHPNAPQRVIETPPELLAIERGPLRNGRRLLALYNVTDGKFDLAHAGDALNQALTQYHWQPLDPLTAHHEETLPPMPSAGWLLKHKACDITTQGNER